jgi:hypothetical protein
MKYVEAKPIPRPTLIPYICSLDSETQIFGFIIAIDQYELKDRFIRLDGCMHDGTAIKDFLTEKLKVPDSHIKFLKNSDATRHSILTSFDDHLINNPAIQENDAIVIYFAGHGCVVEPPEDWSTNGRKVEALCPYDAETIDGESGRVYVIPDRTLGTKFRQLACKKGNNIVRHLFLLQFLS